MKHKQNYRCLLWVLVAVVSFENQIFGQPHLRDSEDNSAAVIPKNAEWLVGASFGSGFGYYTKTKMTPFAPLHWGLDIAYKSITFSAEGLLGWPSLKQNIIFPDEQIFDQSSVIMFQGVAALGINIWLTDRLYMNPQFGYALASINSRDTQSGNRINEYSRSMLSSSLNFTYEFPIERNAAGKRSKFPYQSIFIRLITSYSMATFNAEGRGFDADLIRVILAVGSNFRSSP